MEALLTLLDLCTGNRLPSKCQWRWPFIIFVLLTWRSFSTNGWVSGYSRRFDDYVMFMLHICFLKAPFTWDAGVYSFFFMSLWKILYIMACMLLSPRNPTPSVSLLFHGNWWISCRKTTKSSLGVNLFCADLVWWNISRGPSHQDVGCHNPKIS